MTFYCNRKTTCSIIAASLIYCIKEFSSVCGQTFSNVRMEKMVDMSKTKIVILQAREIIYTAIFVGLGILLLIVLFFMFWPSGSSSKKTAGTYKGNAIYEAGIYNEELTIGESRVELQVTLDEDRVKSVKVVNLDESVSAMYPLMKPSVKNISKQLASGVSIDEVVLSEESQYTEKLVLEKVKDVMKENTAQNKK